MSETVETYHIAPSKRHPGAWIVWWLAGIDRHGKRFASREEAVAWVRQYSSDAIVPENHRG